MFIPLNISSLNLPQSTLHSPNDLHHLKSCHAIAETMLSPQTIRLLDPCPAASANHKAHTQLWRPSWPARLLPQRGFLPFLYYGGFFIIYPFIAFYAPFHRLLSVPYVLDSYFEVKNNFPSLPSLHLCRTSCYCQSKTSSFFPCPVGCACWVWSFQPLLAPERKRLNTRTWGFALRPRSCPIPELLEPLPPCMYLTSMSCRVLSSAASRIWSCLWHDPVMPLAWLLCFKGRIRGFAGTLKHSSSSKAQSFCHGAWGSLSMMQQFGSLRAADAISLQHIQVLFAVKPLLVLNADEWQALTGICLTDTRPDRWVGKGFWSNKALSITSPTCCPACPLALQPPSEAEGRVRLMLPTESKSHLSDHGCRHPAEMLKFTWTPGGCRQQGSQHSHANLLVAPSSWGRLGRAAMASSSSSPRSSLAPSDQHLPPIRPLRLFLNGCLSSMRQRWRCNGPMLLTAASKRAV